MRGSRPTPPSRCAWRTRTHEEENSPHSTVESTRVHSSPLESTRRVTRVHRPLEYLIQYQKKKAEKVLTTFLGGHVCPYGPPIEEAPVHSCSGCASYRAAGRIKEPPQRNTGRGRACRAATEPPTADRSFVSAAAARALHDPDCPADLEGVRSGAQHGRRPSEAAAVTARWPLAWQMRCGATLYNRRKEWRPDNDARSWREGRTRPAC